MAILHLIGNYDESWLECQDCDMRFQVIFNRNVLYETIEYCPFCGELVEEVLNKLEE